ncbi:MAG: hypothetical protein QXL47_01290 [Candidatus Anstonellales archaeon]
MGAFDKVSEEAKKAMVAVWKTMNPEDKMHFVNQVALALSIWGDDEKGKEMVALIMEKLVEDGSKNLADFGLYIEWFLRSGGEEIYRAKAEKAKRAVLVIDGYRIKHGLPSEPQKTIL